MVSWNNANILEWEACTKENPRGTVKGTLNSIVFSALLPTKLPGPIDSNAQNMFYTRKTCDESELPTLSTDLHITNLCVKVESGLTVNLFFVVFDSCGGVTGKTSWTGEKRKTGTRGEGEDYG